MSDELPSVQQLRIVQSVLNAMAASARVTISQMQKDHPNYALDKKLIMYGVDANECVAMWLGKVAKERERCEEQQAEIRALIERTKLPDVKEPDDE